MEGETANCLESRGSSLPDSPRLPPCLAGLFSLVAPVRNFDLLRPKSFCPESNATMPSLRRLAGLLLLTAVSGTGCRTWNKARFNHGEGVNGDSVLVVPFAEPRQSLWYGESENGKIVAEAFKAWVRANADPNFAEGEAVDQVMRQVLNWQEKKVTSAQWKILTAGLGVKYVLYGEIERLSLTRPDKIGILEPSVEAVYRVVNVETEAGTLAFESPISVDFSRGHETEFPLLDLGSDTKSVTRKLLAKLGAQMGKDLYGYYSE